MGDTASLLDQVKDCRGKLQNRALFEAPSPSYKVDGRDYTAYKACCYVFMHENWRLIDKAFAALERELKNDSSTNG